MSTRNKLILSAAVVLAVLLAVKLFVIPKPVTLRAEAPPDVIRLNGAVHDFVSGHPDFGVSGEDVSGHSVQLAAAQLTATRRPALAGPGVTVASQWYDEDANPIMPYAAFTDPGLPGGHFDVDVFDEPSTKELYHEHQFDDKFDVTYVDIAHDPKLLFGEVVGADYPNQLRLEFLNPHHGSGTFTFEAGAVNRTGSTQKGFHIAFDPGALTQCRIDFTSLMDLRGTNPGTVQGDAEDRDDALSVRMYDVTTNSLVYELAIYHHVKGDFEPPSLPGGFQGSDACGESIDDTFGAYGSASDGAVTDEVTFAQWFSEVPGTNLSKAHSIDLVRNAAGVYEYLSNDFYPIDGKLLGNEGEAHNDLFTYAIRATFTYDQCEDLFFEFEGNDDAWVYINDRLSIDLGGTATPARQYVALDRLGLVDGQTYPLSFFYAQRQSAGQSVFRMRTNIPLQTGTVIVGGTYD